jgi:SAM-dependent methyltransferase
MTRDDWDLNAHEWARRTGSKLDLSREHVLFPALVRAFQEVQGRDVLDAGCGSADLGIILHQHYGFKIVGLDSSFAMCREAYQRSNSGIGIICGDVMRLPFVSESFDAVAANMVMSSVEDILACCTEFSRILKQSGMLIFTILHPARVIPANVNLGREANDHLDAVDSVREIDEYVRERKINAPLRLGGPSRLPRSVSYYHRTLSTYSTALRDSGFVIVSLLEPLPDSLLLDKHVEMAPFWRLLPFLVVIAEKLRPCGPVLCG